MKGTLRVTPWLHLAGRCRTREPGSRYPRRPSPVMWDASRGSMHPRYCGESFIVGSGANVAGMKSSLSGKSPGTKQHQCSRASPVRSGWDDGRSLAAVLALASAGRADRQHRFCESAFGFRLIKLC